MLYGYVLESGRLGPRRPARATDRRHGIQRAYLWHVRPLWLIRERYELRFARHHREPTFSPIGFRLFDTLGGTRDEIPPKVTWLVERLRARRGKAGRSIC